VGISIEKEPQNQRNNSKFIGKKICQRSRYASSSYRSKRGGIQVVNIGGDKALSIGEGINSPRITVRKGVERGDHKLLGGESEGRSSGLHRGNVEKRRKACERLKDERSIRGEQ